MIASTAHTLPTLLAAFAASLVECVEALTVVLAVGTMRGWRGALAGTGLALLTLFALVTVLGTAIARVPLHAVQLVLGTLLLLFGLRWLRKAILRAAGVIPLRDETVAYARQTAALGARGGRGSAWDQVAIAAAWKITMIEGIEVVFIVVAASAGGPGLLLPASLGALAALAVVVLLGLALHRPLATIPENTLKFGVGVLLCAFGTFWAGEGAGVRWPGGDWALFALIAGFLTAAIGLVWLMRRTVQVAGSGRR